MAIRRVAYVQCHYCRADGPLVPVDPATSISGIASIKAAEREGWLRLRDSTYDVCPDCRGQLSQCACGCGSFVAGTWVRGHNAAEAAERRNSGEGRQTLRPV